MNSVETTTENLNVIRLQLGSEKFHQITSDIEKLTISVYFGDLQDVKVVNDSIKRVIKRFKSTIDVNTAIMEMMNAKLDEGYELMSESEETWFVTDDMIKPENTNIGSEVTQEEYISSGPTKSIPLKTELWGYIDEINSKAVELNVQYEPDMDCIKISGEESALTEFSKFIENLSKPIADERICYQEEEKEEEKVEAKPKKVSWEEKKEREEDVLGPYIQRELKLSASTKSRIREVEARADDFQLIYQDLDDKIVLAGYQANVLDFLNWLYDFTVMAMEAEIKEIKEVKLSQQTGEFSQAELSISTFHRIHKDAILKRANALNIICDFGYDVILAAAASDTIRDFKSYLQELETTAKRMLYPKYWDFHDINPYLEVDVLPGSEEFEEVALLFNRSLKNMNLLKVKRIQNRYLMETYVTMLQKRQELRPDVEINRKLLFHGTKQNKPEQIYKDSDTGFDLQFANQGMYGKGLYFAVDANYSHNGYTYNLGNGRYQMILADVFIGKPYKSQPNNTYKKAPNGYDSVEAVGGFYIVYNNFHSYPLYLIEYGGGNQANQDQQVLSQPIFAGSSTASNTFHQAFKNKPSFQFGNVQKPQDLNTQNKMPSNQPANQDSFGARPSTAPSKEDASNIFRTLFGLNNPSKK